MKKGPRNIGINGAPAGDPDKPIDLGIVRSCLFEVNETKGERINTLKTSQWLKDTEEGSDAEIRYGLAGKLLQTFRTHFIIFVQIKGQGVVVIKEGECDDLRLKKLWKDFLADYKKTFGDELNIHDYGIADMDVERRDRIFEAVISMEK